MSNDLPFILSPSHKEDILGFSLTVGDSFTCCDEIIDYVSKGSKSWLACFNPHSYVVSISDRTFSEALHHANFLVPDGIGVVIASRILKGQIADRVTGSHIFHGLSYRMNVAGGFKVFFLGATEETLTTIRARMANDYPNIQVAGSYSPPFKASYTREELNDMINAVNVASPDILWVGMTAPKQEKWIYQNFNELNFKFAAGIGAVFDFYAGNVKRSHPVFQRLGLEWLPRLLQQPRRLWKRTFISAPIFINRVLRQRFKN
ncbi:MAG: glycosyltransferase [Gammaproteobacteria bacterium]|nr:glycosyltransferase [Gammaproteobacteria bacterium]|tara:strand:- start:73 stop:855 length:783 start_codon:yes stop_codon:yes gene_type:complete